MRITKEEQILNFSMEQIIEHLLHEGDIASRCIALRLDSLHSKYLDKLDMLQEHNDKLESDLEDLRELIAEFNFLEGGK